MKFDFNTSNPYSYMRFTGYKIEKIDDSMYIIPQVVDRENSRTVYDLFGKIDCALADLLNIGRMCVENENNNESDNKILMSILKFVEQYGMFGFMVEATRNPDFMRHTHVYLKEGNVITTKKEMGYTTYFKMFFPLSNERFAAESILERKIEIEGTPILQNVLKNNVIDKQFIYSEFYCEKIDWIIRYAKKMYNLFNNMILLMNSDSKIEDMEKAKESILKFTASGVAYTINMYGFTPEISWQPNSLKQALDLVFGFFICSEKNPIKMCKHCEKVFVTKNPKAEYCSPQCRNQANVYKSRAKSKLDE